MSGRTSGINTSGHVTLRFPHVAFSNGKLRFVAMGPGLKAIQDAYQITSRAQQGFLPGKSLKSVRPMRRHFPVGLYGQMMISSNVNRAKLQIGLLATVEKSRSLIGLEGLLLSLMCSAGVRTDKTLFHESMAAIKNLGIPKHLCCFGLQSLVIALDRGAGAYLDHNQLTSLIGDNAFQEGDGADAWLNTQAGIDLSALGAALSSRGNRPASISTDPNQALESGGTSSDRQTICIAEYAAGGAIGGVLLGALAGGLPSAGVGAGPGALAGVTPGSAVGGFAGALICTNNKIDEDDAAEAGAKDGSASGTVAGQAAAKGDANDPLANAIKNFDFTPSNQDGTPAKDPAASNPAPANKETQNNGDTPPADDTPAPDPAPPSSNDDGPDDGYGSDIPGVSGNSSTFPDAASIALRFHFSGAAFIYTGMPKMNDDGSFASAGCLEDYATQHPDSAVARGLAALLITQRGNLVGQPGEVDETKTSEKNSRLIAGSISNPFVPGGSGLGGGLVNPVNPIQITAAAKAATKNVNKT